MPQLAFDLLSSLAISLPLVVLLLWMVTADEGHEGPLLIAAPRLANDLDVEP